MYFVTPAAFMAFQTCGRLCVFGRFFLSSPSAEMTPSQPANADSKFAQRLVWFLRIRMRQSREPQRQILRFRRKSFPAQAASTDTITLNLVSALEFMR